LVFVGTTELLATTAVKAGEPAVTGLVPLLFMMVRTECAEVVEAAEDVEETEVVEAVETVREIDGSSAFFVLLCSCLCSAP
jgi:hypothetical protein